MKDSTILVVDDDPDMRFYLRGCLSGLGEGPGMVLEAADGEEALRIVRSAHVDLVVSDVVLPRLDGQALREAIRNDPRHEDLPVLLISGREGSVPHDPAGAWLSKPFNARQLLGAVERLLARSTP